MYVIAILLFVLGVGFLVAGHVFDYCEHKYGWPPRLPLRWEFIGVLVANVFMLAAVVIAIIAHYHSG